MERVTRAPVIASARNVPDMDCTLIVPTRNRADELRVTAEHLIRCGFGAVPTIVIDDASDDPAATREAVSALTNCRVLFQHRRTGQAAARNLGLETATTPYCLLLDDDAHMEEGDSLRAVLRETLDPSVAIWRFEAIREVDGYRDGFSADAPAMDLHSFIGFGALMDRKAVLGVGGFRSFLRYRHEEEDLSMRLIRAGFRIRYRPGVRFIHRHTPVARDSAEYAFLSARNVLLLHTLNAPWPVGLFLGVAKGLSVVRYAGHRVSKFRGVLCGIWQTIIRLGSRTPMSRAQWKAYCALRRWELEEKSGNGGRE